MEKYNWGEHASYAISMADHDHAIINEKLKNELMEIVKTPINDFFNENPNVTYVCWTQYIPYWNDGEECEFDINDLYFTNFGGSIDEILERFEYGELYEEEEDKKNGVWVECVSSYQNKNPTKSYKNFDSLIRGNSVIFEKAFGSHSMVVLSKDSIDIFNYEHD